jgi:DNA repair protein RadC
MPNIIHDRARYRDGHVELVIEGTKELSVTSLVTYFAETGKTRGIQESMWVVPVDGMEQVRAVVEVARGGYHEVTVDLPTIYTAVLAAGCDRFVIVHNHPTDEVSPTVPDLDLTRKVMAGANAIGLFFDDHIIVAPKGIYFSFAQSGLIRQSERLQSMAQTNQRIDVATAKSVER